LKRKNKKRFFPFQSMSNLNFAKLILVNWLNGFPLTCACVSCAGSTGAGTTHQLPVLSLLR
jgi:hypothetical protein